MISFVEFDTIFFRYSRKWLLDREIQRLTMSKLSSEMEALKWFYSLSDRMDYKIWGIQYDNQAVGVCGIKHIESEKGEYWGYIGEKAYWGKGIGSSMVDFVETNARQLNLKQLYLCVLEDNLRALNLYQRKGFKRTNQEKNTLLLIKEL